ncbi:MAG: hypothetical protein P8Y70_08890 [Candidatus Lokiarchaeota archaeon]
MDNNDTKDTENIKDKKENEDPYQLKICPTDLYGDKLIKILEEEFEKEKKKKVNLV